MLTLFDIGCKDLVYFDDKDHRIAVRINTVSSTEDNVHSVPENIDKEESDTGFDNNFEVPLPKKKV